MTRSRLAVVIEDRVMVPRAALDHAGYRAWVTSDEYPEKLRTAFVAGEVLVEMTPESIDKHNQVKTALTVALGTFVREHDLGVIYSDGALLTHEDAELSCEPDLMFVSWQAFETGRVRFAPRAGDETDSVEMIGSPDLIVEIVSDASVRKDTRLLREAYLTAGVTEYWLIDARGPGIRFEILVNDGRSFAASAAPDAPQPSRVLGGRWLLTRERNRAGRFTYRLDQVPPASARP